MKKITISLVLILILIISVFASCSPEGSQPENKSTIQENNTSVISSIPQGESSSESNNREDIIFDESNSSAHEASVPEISLPEVSKPEVSFPDESEPDISTPETSSPDESTPQTSVPEISEPAHTCSFVKGKTTAPTCTDKGYTIYSCSCGKREKRDYTSALGHSWSDWETIKEPTTTSTGVEQRYCTRSGCDASETRVLDELPSDEDKYNVPATAENAHLVEERVLYYLNQYRISEGTAEATFLWEGKTYKYAKARAEQLVTNFAHDMKDIYAVATELEFGRYHGPEPDSYIDPDTGEIVYTGEMTEPYYSPGCSEAITKGYGTTTSWTVDMLAKKVAANIYSSKTHWSYVGAETTKYISVGSYCRGADGFYSWYFCIATSSSDQYD